MRNIFTIIAIIILGILTGLSVPLFAAGLDIPGGDIISNPSIPIDTPPGPVDEVILDGGFKILGFLKLFVSGLALIYLVLIGVYMVVYSENEEKIKSQRKQITYALIGFLFLNLPGIAYTAFSPEKIGTGTLEGTNPWSDTTGGSPFWNILGFNDTLGPIVGFMKLFIFGVAVVLFTWGLFRMIISAGNEEAQKQGKNRLIYGLLGLVFLGFVQGWSLLVAEGDFGGKIQETGGKLLGIAIFFAAPTAVFFLIWGAYYYITSAGDEERVKKGKTILMNTFIATLILIASLSFMIDLLNF